MLMKLEDKLVHPEIKKSIKMGHCNKTVFVNYCAFYKETGCPETCHYAEKINNKNHSE